MNAKENVVLLGPPGTGKTHSAIAVSIRACLQGQRVGFATATEWVARLGDARRQGRLEDELRRLERLPLLVVDEVGYIPFDPDAANLMFMLVSRRYERASTSVTSNKPFSGWGEIFGDEVVAAVSEEDALALGQVGTASTVARYCARCSPSFPLAGGHGRMMAGVR